MCMHAGVELNRLIHSVGRKSACLVDRRVSGPLGRDPYDQATIAKEEVKEEEPEPFQKIGPKTGDYTCEFRGKQYKYSTPSQEHVALHAPIHAYPAATQQPGRPRDPGSFKAEANRTSKAITRERPVPAYLPDSCGDIL
ncbi:zinc finger protein 618-like [Pituophis catenifer annectens]|uniref:zinc finger protein 618-like n=1 Tax=Pituophis catenifer annectens TaxID=94852 RepID=UPI00399195A6